VSLVILGAASMAAFIPAWRASHLDPLTVIRGE
jgi:ABC-type lipoprotein release transport system permease subunit